MRTFALSHQVVSQNKATPPTAFPQHFANKQSLHQFRPGEPGDEIKNPEPRLFRIRYAVEIRRGRKTSLALKASETTLFSPGRMFSIKRKNWTCSEWNILSAGCTGTRQSQKENLAGGFTATKKTKQKKLEVAANTKAFITVKAHTRCCKCTPGDKQVPTGRCAIKGGNFLTALQLQSQYKGRE